MIQCGGVSKRKFDFTLEILEELGVEKVFYRVAQYSGNLFGLENTNTIVFSFPGNPASTFASYHIYLTTQYKL